MDEYSPTFELPGFRFHPTEQELLGFYLKNMVNGKKMHLDIIRFLNIYHHDPWDLPGLARVGEREWYFFVPRDRKHSNGGRPNRTTKHGFWKATGSDRKIVSMTEPNRVLGLRKTLVYYQGRAPRGEKQDWIMSEYRLPDNCPLPKEIVLCKIYRKATSLKELEQRAAKEEEEEKDKSNNVASSYPTSPLSSSNCGQLEDLLLFVENNNNIMDLKKEEEIEENNCKTPCAKRDLGSCCCDCKTPSSSSNKIQLPIGGDTLGELQVPRLDMDWGTRDLVGSQCSPWLENLLNYSSPTLFTQFLYT